MISIYFKLISLNQFLEGNTFFLRNYFEQLGIKFKIFRAPRLGSTLWCQIIIISGRFFFGRCHILQIFYIFKLFWPNMTLEYGSYNDSWHNIDSS